MVIVKYIKICLSGLCFFSFVSISQAQSIKQQLQGQQRQQQYVQQQKATELKEAARIKKGQLSLQELFQLADNDNVGSVDKFLSNKGWKMHNTNESTMTFAFDKNEYNDRALAWFIYAKSSYTVTYQFTDDAENSQFVKQLTSRSYTQESTNLLSDGNGGIETVFRNSRYRIVLQKKLNKTSSGDAAYLIKVHDYIRRDEIEEAERVKTQLSLSELLQFMQTSTLSEAEKTVYTKGYDNDDDHGAFSLKYSYWGPRKLFRDVRDLGVGQGKYSFTKWKCYECTDSYDRVDKQLKVIKCNIQDYVIEYDFLEESQFNKLLSDLKNYTLVSQKTDIKEQTDTSCGAWYDYKWHYCNDTYTVKINHRVYKDGECDGDWWDAIGIQMGWWNVWIYNRKQLVELYNDTLQMAVNDYNALLKQYSYDYDENHIEMSLSSDMESSVRDTLQLLLGEIRAKKTALEARYKKDSFEFKKCNEKLLGQLAEANKQLLDNPYNIQRLIIEEAPLSTSLFGKSKELHKELSDKLALLSNEQERIEKKVYNDVKINNPQLFVEIYYSLNPQQKQQADSVYLECRCQYSNRLSIDTMLIYNSLIPKCECRESKYNEVKSLYHSREEFDQSYNNEESVFEQEVVNRKKMWQEIRLLDEKLLSMKQVNMKKALSSSKPDVADVISKVSAHRDSFYYTEAIDLIFKYDEKLAKEWGKNGSYFKSKEEMYEYWIQEEYDKMLKARKKE